MAHVSCVGAGVQVRVREEPGCSVATTQPHAWSSSAAVMCERDRLRAPRGSGGGHPHSMSTWAGRRGWKALRRAVAAAASAMEKGRGGSSLRWAIRQGAAVRMDGEGKGGAQKEIG